MKHLRKRVSIPAFFFVVTALLAISSVVQNTESANSLALATGAEISWTHLSTTSGDLELPGGSDQQTSSLILDIDRDGLNDFVVSARTDPGPSLVWYERRANSWARHVIESDVLRIEAGGDYYDIDGDNDLDIVMGGDGQSNEVWWWENPYPNYGSDWTRRLIKDSGENKHHDQMFGDFDDDGDTELVFWNQKDDKLVLAEIPSDPRNSGTWSQRKIYSWTSGNQREGLAAADIDLDGLVDIVGGGRWFKYNKSTGNFAANTIDSSQEYGRVAAGQLKKGGRPEVVFVSGDGTGPLKWYEWNGSSWVGTQLLSSDVDHGHTLQIEDVNRDGNLDIFVAEMRLSGSNSNAKIWIFFGDGNGNFTTTEVASGYGNHESKLGDLDGDGDLDILGKPYNWQTPRLDIWLNESSCEPSLDQWDRHVIDSSRPERAIFVYPGDINGDGLQDVVSGAWWYKNPGSPSGSWSRKTIGSPLNNAAAVYDFDNDNDLDILGTEGVGADSNDDFVWARNNGSGSFTILDNIDKADGDFLQGVAVDEFVNGNTEVALSWHKADKGIQMLDVPNNPSNDNWPWRQISTTSLDEGLSSGDIDRDGDRDLLLGTKWLRNKASADSGSDWAISNLPYRVLATVDMNGTARSDKPAEFTVYFTDLLASAGDPGTFDPNSLRVVEVDGSNNVLNNNVPFQFDPDASYDADTYASGKMVILLEGQSTQSSNRRYHTYFDTLNGAPATPASVTPLVVLTDGAFDEGQESYEIQTDNATYFYHKDSGGFSSLIDTAGNDWINHSDAAGSAGDYRGIPNLVHPNDGGYFHPGRSGVISSVLSQGPLKATIFSATSDDKWETMWEIYPDHARLTVLKADVSYWFLYEGTPGGLLDIDSDFVVRSDGTQTLLGESWKDDLTAPEWVFFSDPNVNRSLYFVHHENDSLVDSYSAMDEAMTVFGFGRDGVARLLSQAPSHFTLGFADQTDVSSVEPALDSAYLPLAITLGTTEVQTQASASASGPWSVHNLFTGSGDPDRNRLADINGDGRLDAVVGYEAISKPGKLAWYKQPTTATNLWAERIIANDVIGPMSLDVADMDGDGDPDVVVGEHNKADPQDARVFVFENPDDDNGTWIRHLVSTGDEHHDGAQLVDIDNDGDLDIISIGWNHDDVLLYENLGCAGGGQPPAPTNTPQPGPTDTPQPPTATNTPVPPTGPLQTIYVSSSTNVSAGGITFGDEDILAFDTASSSWSMYFDGSDVGLSASSSHDIDAFHLHSDGSILFSMRATVKLPDVGSVDDSDIVRFVPTSIGDNTAGSFSLYFDGSDVDLTADGEDVDALVVLDNGDLLLSTLGSWSAGGFSGGDEDLLHFTPSSTGSNTNGSWSIYFDGSDVALTGSDEEIWGAWSNSNGGEIYFSTRNVFSVPGASGDGADILRCIPTSLGSSTDCSFDLFWDGSNHDIKGELVDGLHFQLTSDDPVPTSTPGGAPPTPTATSTPLPSDSSLQTVYVSGSTNVSAGGITFGDEDILAFDAASSSWSMYFDGSDVGLSASSSHDIDAFHLHSDGSILFSMRATVKLPDIGSVDDSDIVRFVPTSIGDNTAGSFSLYFDGSDVDLTADGEDVDALVVLDNGDLLLSTLGSWSAGGFSGGDEDLLHFAPSSTGSNTNGSWSIYLDGSDVALTGGDEEIWGAWSNSNGGEIYFSTRNVFSVPGASGDGADILRCIPTSLGSSTDCSFDLIWDGSSYGIAGELVDGIHIILAETSGDPVQTNTPTPSPTNTSAPTATAVPGDPSPTPTPTSPAAGDGRVTLGLLALYDFEQGNDINTVYDISESGSALDLTITSIDSSWLAGGGLVINGSSSIASFGAATKINQAVQTSNEVTLEAWIMPANINQDGPARIVSISQDTSNRNLTLGQGLWGTQPSDLFDLRLRTTSTDMNGSPSLSTASGSASTQLQHLVFTFGGGQSRVYKNGSLIANTSLSGSLDNWNAAYPLVLANEATGDRPWLGEFHLVAFYDHALSTDEVNQNFQAGTGR